MSFARRGFIVLVAIQIEVLFALLPIAAAQTSTPLPTPWPTNTPEAWLAHPNKALVITCQTAGALNPRRIEAESKLNGPDCWERLGEKIRNLSPEDFFSCTDDNDVCRNANGNCDCKAYIDEDCLLSAIGNQTPRGRCIFRSTYSPPLYNGIDVEWPRDSGGDKYYCGYWAWAKGGCRCVPVPIRPEPTATISVPEPIIQTEREKEIRSTTIGE